MRRLTAFLIIALWLPVLPADAAGGGSALYRSGKALQAAMAYSGSWSGGADHGSGRFSVFAFQPSTAGAIGYASGAGTIATPALPGDVDLAKPWIALTHSRAGTETPACATVANLAPEDFTLVDTAQVTIASARVACDDGLNTEYEVMWLRTAAFDRLAMTFPFGSDDSPGTATVHGMDANSHFAVCGDVTGCVVSTTDQTQSVWRVFDGHAVYARA